jgi:hypothetical protein
MTMTSSDRSPGIRPRFPHRAVIVVFVVAIVVAGMGFAFKLFEFLEDLLDECGLHFAGAHLLIYILVAAGFLLLLGYAFLSGHFADIEQPKYDLLERERNHDREEFGHAGKRSGGG